MKLLTIRSAMLVGTAGFGRPIRALCHPTAALLRVAVGASLLPAAAFAKPGLTTIWTFTGGQDGSYPLLSTLIPGPGGSLYGTTEGGTTGYGTAFQLVPPAPGATAWTLSLLHSFSGGADGGRPHAMIVDREGNLYGEGELGGDPHCHLAAGFKGCGMIYELSPPAAGGVAWTEKVLYNFEGAEGAYPQTGLVRDRQGNLFGTAVQTKACFPKGCGVVFELSPPASGQSNWTERTLYTFTRETDGRVPDGRLVLDNFGALYGVTNSGGIQSRPNCGTYDQCGYGLVYKLTPPAQAGDAWTKTTLWSFSGHDGSYPSTDLTLDRDGNVFGMTEYGGRAAPCPYKPKQYAGCGTVFELSPPSRGQIGWKLSTPWKFTGTSDGRYPFGAGLVPYRGFYLTTVSGDEVHDFGGVELFKPSVSTAPPTCPPNPGPDYLCPQTYTSPDAGHWREQTLFKFTNNADGENPGSSLLERDGIFYGETTGLQGTQNGPASYGTVFSFTP